MLARDRDKQSVRDVADVHFHQRERHGLLTSPMRMVKETPSLIMAVSTVKTCRRPCLSDTGMQLACLPKAATIVAEAPGKDGGKHESVLSRWLEPKWQRDHK